MDNQLSNPDHTELIFQLSTLFSSRLVCEWKRKRRGLYGLYQETLRSPPGSISRTFKDVGFQAWLGYALVIKCSLHGRVKEKRLIEKLSHLTTQECKEIAKRVESVIIHPSIPIGQIKFETTTPRPDPSIPLLSQRGQPLSSTSPGAMAEEHPGFRHGAEVESQETASQDSSMELDFPSLDLFRLESQNVNNQSAQGQMLPSLQKYQSPYSLLLRPICSESPLGVQCAMSNPAQIRAMKQILPEYLGNIVSRVLVEREPITAEATHECLASLRFFFPPIDRVDPRVFIPPPCIMVLEFGPHKAEKLGNKFCDAGISIEDGIYGLDCPGGKVSPSDYLIIQGQHNKDLGELLGHQVANAIHCNPLWGQELELGAKTTKCVQLMVPRNPSSSSFLILSLDLSKGYRLCNNLCDPGSSTINV